MNQIRRFRSSTPQLTSGSCVAHSKEATVSGNTEVMASPTSESSSIFGISTELPSKLLSIAMGSAARPLITIHLFDPRDKYSTFDKISGKVQITATHDTPFDDVEIQFIGVCKTDMQIPTRPNAALQKFLKLTILVPPSAHEQPRTLKAGNSYDFPFTFVVPEQLLPHACRHAVEHDSAHMAHLRLPPSLGRHGHCAGEDDFMDDLAPIMATVKYQIVANLLSNIGKQVLASATKQIRILPVFEEEPPLVAEGPDSDFILRNEKTISKGFLKSKLGTLVAQAAQPRAFCLPDNDTDSETLVSTVVNVKLRFDPADKHAEPPRLDTLYTKLKATTWYATKALTNFPSNKFIQSDFRQGKYSETVPLSARCIVNVEWTFHEPAEDKTPMTSRREVAFPIPSERYMGGGFYSAELMVPVTLPTDQNIMPTFHQCLMSRTYQLNLRIAAKSGSMEAPSVELKLPVQVSSDQRSGVASVSSPRSSSSLQQQADETDDTNTSCIMQTVDPMDERFSEDNSALEMAVDLPPRYEFPRR